MTRPSPGLALEGDRLQRAFKSGVALALAGFLSGCAGAQSALDVASADAAIVASLWWAMLAVGAATLLLVCALLAMGLWRARSRAEAAPLGRRAAVTLVALGGVALPLLAVSSMVIGSGLIGARIAARETDPAITVEANGRLWWWDIRYLDANGREVARTANEIHIPVGAPVRFQLKSDNVIHSFWPPSLQGKTDMIPGRVNETWINARKTGVYRGQCAEFCGAQHSFMGFLVVVQEQGEFYEWLKRMAQPAGEPDDDLVAEGRKIFLNGPCSTCHTVSGTPADGKMGPDLTHLASRRTLAAGTIPNTRGHLAGWIADPQSVKPGALMPPTLLAPKDLQALTAYLLSLK